MKEYTRIALRYLGLDILDNKYILYIRAKQIILFTIKGLILTVHSRLITFWNDMSEYDIAYYFYI